MAVTLDETTIVGGFAVVMGLIEIVKSLIKKFVGSDREERVIKSLSKIAEHQEKTTTNLAVMATASTERHKTNVATLDRIERSVS